MKDGAKQESLVHEQRGKVTYHDRSIRNKKRINSLEWYKQTKLAHN